MYDEVLLGSWHALALDERAGFNALFELIPDERRQDSVLIGTSGALMVVYELVGKKIGGL